jgi:hypothetical protein
MPSILSKLIVTEDGFHYPESISSTLLKSIPLNDIPEPEQIGLARENVIQAYEDFSNCRFTLLNKTDEPLEIACIVPAKSVNGLYVFQLIALLNRLPSVRFSLYIHPAIVNEVASICNQHIRVIAFFADEKITIHTHLVLTYGLRAIHFLRTGIPLFILGPNGLGGLVTPINLPFLFHSRFMGRPGGSLHELIPEDMMAHELGLFKDVQNVDSFLKEIQGIALAFPIKSISEERCIQNASMQKLQEAYTNKASRENLVPKLSSNMRMIKQGHALIIRRTGLHDTLCTMDNEEAGFLKDINGIHTCGFIREKHNLADNEFWEIIDILLQKYIITVSL